MADRLRQIPTRDELRRGKHLIPSFLELHTLDMTVWDDDFMGDQMRYDGTAPGTYQSTASGTSAATAAIVAGSADGIIRLDPGTDNDGRSDLSLGRHFRGNRNAVVWWRVLMPAAITAMKFELGFTDVVSGTDAGAVATKATPTFNATDAVILVMDTDDDTNLTLVGNLNGTAATAYDFSTVLAVDLYYYFGIALIDTRAQAYLLDANGNLLETQPSQGRWMESAITAATLLTPWAFVQNRSANQRLLDIDRLLVYQWKTATASGAGG